MVVRDEERKTEARCEEHQRRSSTNLDGPRRSTNERSRIFESDDGARGSEAEREVKRQNHNEQTDRNIDQPGDDVRGTRRRQKAKENRRKENAPGDRLLREETA